MFRTFLKFELAAWLRAPLPWIFLFIFGLLSFFATITDSVTIGGSFGNIYKNAPFVVQNWYGVFSILSLLLLTAFVNTAAIRDFENKTSGIVFTKPIRKSGYYFGHFLGAILISLIPVAGVSLGMWLGTAVNGVTEWLDPERFGPLEVRSHLNSFLTIVIPNTVFAGGILYAVAALTRSTLYSFIAAMLLLVGYIVAGGILSDIENEQLAALLDPFGFGAMQIITKYWTVDDKNTMTVGLFHPGWVLNRFLWMAIGVGTLLFGYLRFSFAERNKRARKTLREEPAQAAIGDAPGEAPAIRPATGAAIIWQQFASQLRANFTGVVKSLAFVLLGLLGLLNLVGGLRFATEGYGTHNLPVTYNMIGVIRSNFYMFVVAIMAYYSGLLTWRERRVGINEIYDAMPTRNWTDLAAKYLTVVGTIALLMVISIGAAVFTQAMFGYTRFELGVYVRELLVIDLSIFAFITALFMLVHALSPNMYLGFFFCIALMIANTFAWDALKISTHMVQFAELPGYTLSDLYGYRPYAKGLFWFGLYWGLFSLGLLVLAILFWPRGKDTAFGKRLRIAGGEWRNYRFLGIGTLGLWLLAGGWVYYNTFQLNTFRNSRESENITVRYETDYKHFQGKAQPRIYDVTYNIEIFPEDRAVNAGIVYGVRNPHAAALDTLLVQLPARVDYAFETDRLRLLQEDQDQHFNIYRIDPPLAPGDSMEIRFTSSYDARGFENNLSVNQILQNGTFFNNGDIGPQFGYQPSRELVDRNRRKAKGLPPRSRLPELDPTDTLNRMNTYIANDADWVNVRTVISTSGDQIAIAPGSLRDSWEENGRNFYRYELDNESLNFYSFMSAAYEVAREEWNGIDLEVYYHPEHSDNVDRMLKSLRKSLEYYTENFGPYYHQQCRIIEFPRYASFAQAFPGTMPYSEGIGFIEDYQADRDDIDMVFYVVAHEMGHQWWAHQECGAVMQGGVFLVETLAQYSALMVMEKEYGRDIMRKFLEYESDSYLRGRGQERIEEMPLARSENQGYIHYRKGSVVMYYLKEMIGEENVNEALRAFLDRYRYAEPPYPVSSDLIAEFERRTPDSLKYIIDDLFWDITLFENRTESASVKELDNGQFEVTIEVTCRKFKADGQGKQEEVAVNDWIDIGAFAKPEKKKKYGKTLYRRRVRIDQPRQTFTFVVDERPDQAGIDPFRLLIDRNPEDNVKEL